MEKRGLAFHCHHDILWEYVYDYDKRVRFIKEDKPPEERELRLKLFQLIPEDRIPGKNTPAWEAYDKASEAYGKAWEACDKACEAFDREAFNKAWKAFDREAFDKAWEAYGKAYGKELEALHTEICPDCTWDGHTIFSGGK